MTVHSSEFPFPFLPNLYREPILARFLEDCLMFSATDLVLPLCFEVRTFADEGMSSGGGESVS